jgi:hypothetical protein
MTGSLNSVGHSGLAHRVTTAAWSLFSLLVSRLE